MTAPQATRRRVALLTAAAIAVPVGLLATTTGAQAAAPTSDRTSAVEARRVDRVPTPKLKWWDCSVFATGAQCATASLPLDYDQPTGPKTAVALLRIKATDQKHKLGTLFLNPGGPGGSGVQIAAAAQQFLSPELLSRFDVVGFDPRGTNFSDNVRCWVNLGEQGKALKGMNVAFPWTAAEKAAYVKSAQAFGRGCSTTGKPLSGSMSTAEVARDMDVLRRAVGDKKLTYLGFSYGTYLGNVYANLFPDRVRAVVIDGVVDPVGWAGWKSTANIPSTVRIRSGEGAAKALHQILVLCGKKGPAYCSFAADGDPLKVYDAIVADLKKAPLVLKDPTTGEVYGTLSYADLVANLLGMLYSPSGSAYIADFLHSVRQLQQPPAAPGTPAAAAQSRAYQTLTSLLSAPKARQVAAKAAAARQAKAFGFSFPYDNSPEAFQSVLCTDGVNPADASSWVGWADTAARTAPDFGRLWAWGSAPCASKTWTVRDEDRYSGPFTHRTASPVLVVGNYWDPATNYDSAVRASRLLPNSRLLSSNSWGHTAYGTSVCVTRSVDNYLLHGWLPLKGTVCQGDVQPFATPLTPAIRSHTAGQDHRAPVVPILPNIPRW